MYKPLIAVVAFAVVLAACGGSGGDGVASLESGSNGEAETVDGEGGAVASDEEIILAFAACMRENGVEDFQDPDFNADGSLNFGGRGLASDVDPDTMRAAFEACQGELEGIAFGPGAIDFTEIQDRLLEFAVCMRENGFDMPDPDFSNFGRGGSGGPFGDDVIDQNDPTFQSALEACEDIFEGFRIGGPRGAGEGGG
ncbi:MAG: hypothetical protein BMS9Abin07_0572 [Acidimicrobiia bacterium]|nr:MAG: hypothetical protein BMS9Abin07_0572 [Acidimicrobiia bacterium]